MDNAMADIQADDMKHGLYDDDLADRVASKLLEVATMDDLESTYYEMQKEWAETLATVQLEEVARDLGIL